MKVSALKPVWIVLGLAAVAMAAWQAGAWRRSASGRDLPATPPAMESTQTGAVLAEGRVAFYPGARVTVSSEVAGLVTNVLVQEQSHVQTGDLLAEVQADDVYASLMEARAHLAEVESEIRWAELELKRARPLAVSGALTPQELDRLTLRLDFLRARRVTATVAVKRQETTLAKTRLTAPIAGVVLERHIQPGEVVRAGSPIVTLGNLERTRIEAEVDEYDAARVRLGAAVAIRAEGCSNVWQGKVEEIPDRISNRVLQPQDPAQPSDVRVLLVKISFRRPAALRLGQRVEVEIRTEPYSN